MPKGWSSQANTTTQGSNNKNMGQMPTPTQLSRPMISPSSIPNYDYRIKKIEIYGVESGEPRNTKHIKLLEIYPIESDYSIELSDGESQRGLPIPFQSLSDIKITQTRKGTPAIEFSFVGNGLVGEANKQYIATILVEEEFLNKVFEVIKAQKDLETDGSYWSHETLFLHTQYGDARNIDVYPLTPFLADGEDMIWQNIHYYTDRNLQSINFISLPFSINYCRSITKKTAIKSAATPAKIKIVFLLTALF